MEYPLDLTPVNNSIPMRTQVTLRNPCGFQIEELENMMEEGAQREPEGCLRGM